MEASGDSGVEPTAHAAVRRNSAWVEAAGPSSEASCLVAAAPSHCYCLETHFTKMMLRNHC